MKKITSLLVFSFFTFLFPYCLFAFDGPLQVKNQFPLFLHLNMPYLENSEIENSFSAVISYSSVYIVKRSSEWDIGLDMEITELCLRFKKNMKDFIEIGLDMPLISFSSGFMDGFINEYHDTFGFSDYGRSNRPDNEFLYEVRRNGALIIKGQNGLIGIGDVRLSIKKPVLKGDPCITIKGDFELPTGNAEEGFGNGSIDTGLSFLVDKNLSKEILGYLNFGIVFPGDLKAHDRITLRDYVWGGTGIEGAFSKNVHLHCQVFVQSSPFSKTGISSVDRTAVLLSLGGRYHFKNSIFEFSFTEDPNTAGTPDFTLSLSLKQIF